MTVPPPHLHGYRHPNEKDEKKNSNSKLILLVIFFAVFFCGMYITVEDINPGFFERAKTEFKEGIKPYFR
jgi:hypothetical protein